MTAITASDRRGLTLIELLLSLLITALVAAAVAAMMGAVTAGVGTRRDNRSTMVRANAAAARLSAYIATSRCVLEQEDADVVLWLDDSRESDTVHATELRWFLFDEATGTIEVRFVDFPSSWSQTARDLEDAEYPAATDWMSVFRRYEQRGWIVSLPLVDGLEGVTIARDAPGVLDTRNVQHALTFTNGDGVIDVYVSAAIRLHRPPGS